MRAILRLLIWLVRLGLAVWLATTAAVMYFSHANLAEHGGGDSLEAPVDALLVLGGGTDGDGVLAFSSRRRVLAAVELLQAGRAEWLILSGTSFNPEYTPSVAEQMRDHAIALGAPPERLIVESAAISTFENLRFGFALAEQRGLRRLAIVTDAFHLERARALAGYFGRPDVGLVAAYGLRADTRPNRVWSILREAVAWWYNLAKVASWEALAAAGLDSDERSELIR
jgi:uncharacterized SAM-binding protein YcdF (DUF218 family)